MIHFNSFDELASNTRCKVTSFCNYSTKYLSRYDAIVKLLSKVMNDNHVIYSPKLATEWVNNLISSNGYGDSTRWRYTRVVNLFNSNWNGELETWRIYPTVFKLSPHNIIFKETVNDFEDFLISEGYEKKTISLRVFSANQFLSWTESNGYSSFDELNPIVVSKYLSSKHFQKRESSGVSTEVIGLKKFLVYLEDKGRLKETCHNACLSRKNISKRIVTIYNDEQVKELFTPLPNSLANLRNKAIFMLAVKCGLRSSDIMNLKFENIDFDNKRLNLIQHKTKEHLIIPFDVEVSNALIDYILNERERNENSYVFLTVSGPTRKLTHTTSFRTLIHFKEKNKPPHDGLHILRRTYASSMLANDISPDVIASLLGHVSLSSVDRYLSTDEKKMRECTLSISDYSYKGDLF